MSLLFHLKYSLDYKRYNTVMALFGYYPPQSFLNKDEQSSAVSISTLRNFHERVLRGGHAEKKRIGFKQSVLCNCSFTLRETNCLKPVASVCRPRRKFGAKIGKCGEFSTRRCGEVNLCLYERLQFASCALGSIFFFSGM